MIRDTLARFEFWLRSLLLVCCVVAFGCGTPATIARKTVTGIDVFNASAARLARVLIKKCVDDAVKVAKAGKPTEAEAAIGKCDEQRTVVVKALKISLDATDTAATLIDAGEAIGEKRYGDILLPVLEAVGKIKKLLEDAGVKVPSIPGVF